MELSYFINLIFIFALNVLFLLLGICLNSLVIISFWRITQLRKKLCYFMIMILSCCDLLVVLTNHPLTAVNSFFWLTGKTIKYPRWALISLDLARLTPIGFSFFALSVMNFDRYLATHYPFFHHTSVTKRKLSALFGVLCITQVAFGLMYVNKIIPLYFLAVIFLIIVGPPLVFINYKLFIIARKSRRNNGMSREVKKSLSFKNISSCLLAVACFVLLQVPGIIYIRLEIASKETPMMSDTVRLALFWSKTSVAMNSTFNCLIFFWKNKILRTEGMKLIKGIKIM